MIIRLGYVAIALNLKNVTSSSTVPFATYKKLKNVVSQIQKEVKIETKLNDLEKDFKNDWFRNYGICRY